MTISVVVVVTRLLSYKRHYYSTKSGIINSIKTIKIIKSIEVHRCKLAYHRKRVEMFL